MLSTLDPTSQELLPPRFRSPPRPRAEAARRRRLQRDLAVAFEHEELVLHYQGRQSLATGLRTDLEALLRWPHPRRGMMPAATLIPLAEETGLMTAVGGWVLAAACREAAGWPEPWVVSVNVSARQLADRSLLDQVAEALDGSGLNPERLELDLAESALVGVDVETLLTLSAIRDLGAGIGLDDFGAGIASLSMLKRLPLTTMKLDRSLVRDLPFDRDDAAIVRAVIDTAHAMGITVVAEGIETEPQRAFLCGCGCDEGQGYLFGKPVPAEALRLAASLV
jgi:EAL domain-containing protein (putative c-di-GMP-specific phosphodiesterase class I)